MFENQTIKMVTAIIGFFAVASLIAAEATWKTNISRDVDEIKSSISMLEASGIDTRLKSLEGRIVGRSSKGWHRDDMMLWQYETQEKNPGWKGGQIKKTPF